MKIQPIFVFLRQLIFSFFQIFSYITLNLRHSFPFLQLEELTYTISSSSFSVDGIAYIQLPIRLNSLLKFFVNAQSTKITWHGMVHALSTHFHSMLLHCQVFIFYYLLHTSQSE